jgi:DNA-binding transcriptional regulator YbjK
LSDVAGVARRPRGTTRRRLILDATLALAGRGGAGAVTHRAVAAEAGVPLAATTYYFSSRDELLAQALEHAATEDLEQLARDAAGYVAEPLTSDTLSERLAATVSGWLRGDRPTLLAQYEVSLEAARRPELAEACRRWTDAYTRAIAAALERLGAADPERDAWIVFAALSGMVLDELAGPRDGFEETVLRPAVDRLVHALTTSP